MAERVVWKFELRPWSIFHDLPRGAEVISAGAQGASVVAWVLCDPNAPKEPRVLAAYPTGVPLPFGLQGTRFVATAQMDDGLVFHVFEGPAVEQDGVTAVRHAPSLSSEPADG